MERQYTRAGFACYYAVRLSSLRQIIGQKRVLICAGSGGVGKTTTAAAIAVEAARNGRNALVLTIDPAKRLANALGVGRLGHSPQPIPRERLSELAIPDRGSLHAMMLDQKRAFDEIVTRYARSPDARERILGNRIYRQISATLTSSHEYAAMAKLYELAQDGVYDLLVVDTPPTAHAMDFLDAPDKVANAVDSPAVDWFTRPFRATGGFSIGLVSKGGSFVLKRLAKFVGSSFLEEMARFFVEAHDILQGFRERGRLMSELMRTNEVGFIVVSSAEAPSVSEALYFHERLISTRLPFAGFVVNRVHPAGKEPPSWDALMGKLEEIPELQAFSASELSLANTELLKSYTDIGALADADQAQITLLRAAARGEPVFEVPLFDEDVHSLASLLRVRDHLASA